MAEMMAWEEKQHEATKAALDEAQKARDLQQVMRLPRQALVLVWEGGAEGRGRRGLGECKWRACARLGRESSDLVC